MRAPSLMRRQSPSPPLPSAAAVLAPPALATPAHLATPSDARSEQRQLLIGDPISTDDADADDLGRAARPRCALPTRFTRCTVLPSRFVVRDRGRVVGQARFWVMHKTTLTYNPGHRPATRSRPCAP
ncbi:hypothetical protein [Actinomadura sp. 6N118]|uniref:hypothetical protein n=1 Tax=Actinomadura sp. 6N118 TaxID=3375151 RepID=UPI0037A039BD